MQKEVSLDIPYNCHIETIIQNVNDKSPAVGIPLPCL